MIPYERTQWYGLSYLTQLSGSLLPRCLPLMIVSGLVAGFVADGAVDRWTNYDFQDIFGETYSMSLFGVVFGYLSVARLNISYNRYWEGITNLKQMHSKWFDACCQILAFDQLETTRKSADGEPCLTEEPWCRHIVRLFAQLSAMSTLLLHSEEPYDPARLSEMMGQFSQIADVAPPKPEPPKMKKGRSFTNRVSPFKKASSKATLKDETAKALEDIKAERRAQLRRSQSGRILADDVHTRTSNRRESGGGESPNRSVGHRHPACCKRVSSAMLAKRRGTMNALMGAHNAGLSDSGHQEQLLSDAEIKFLQNLPCPVHGTLQRIIRSLTTRQRAGGVMAPAPLVSRVYQELSNGLIAYNMATKMKEVAVPFAYVQFNALLLQLFSIITPVAIACFT